MHELLERCIIWILAFVDACWGPVHLDFKGRLKLYYMQRFLRSNLCDISHFQEWTMKCRAVEGQGVVERTVEPNDGVRRLLVKVIQALGAETPITVDSAPVEVEWTESVPESSKTILYLHGGAFFSMDPATHRQTTEALTAHTGHRCCSVRYRLAPQAPFPAGLLDALGVYFHLVYSLGHSVVLAGDSAGGNLCLAILQALIQMRKMGLKVDWSGSSHDIKLPAGVAVVSPWVDLENPPDAAPFDYIPGPRELPRCKLWPADQLRRSPYAEDALLGHPLVTLKSAPDWSGSPPVFICYGSESLSIQIKPFTVTLSSQNVSTVVEKYDGMPHCFALFFPWMKVSEICYKRWAGFIRQAVEAPSEIKTERNEFPVGEWGSLSTKDM